MDPTSLPPITGYVQQTPTSIGRINAVKELEAKLMQLLEDVADDDNRDDIAVARTSIRTGCMWAVRAIAKPTN